MGKIEDYRAFIAAKRREELGDGIAALTMADAIKLHQSKSVEFALENARSALFLDTGLGKSLCELEWARQVADHTRKPVLTLTPLAVRERVSPFQMRKFMSTVAGTLEPERVIADLGRGVIDREAIAGEYERAQAEGAAFDVPGVVISNGRPSLTVRV